MANVKSRKKRPSFSVSRLTCSENNLTRHRHALCANDNFRFIAAHNNERIFPPEQGAKSGRQRVEGVLKICSIGPAIKDFRFHDLRRTFPSWYMINGGDLYELAKILGHTNIEMTERYAKLEHQYIAT